MRQIDKVIKGSSAKGKDLIARSKCNQGTSIYDVYEKPSREKIEAFERCLELYASQEKPSDFHITGHNRMSFSCCFTMYFSLWDRPTLVYITKDHTYAVMLDE